MTTPFWCLLIVAFIPYVLAGLGGYFRVQQLGTLDNKLPRVQALQLEGIGARTYSAQMNAWEALALFATAVLVAHAAGADAGRSATAATLFVVARFLHAFFYIANLDVLRSGIQFVGLGACVWLFVLAAQA